MKKSIMGWIFVFMLLCHLPVFPQPGNGDWGTNKYIAPLSQKCAVSLAENGYIYLLHHYIPSFTGDMNGWILYVSQDGGQTFNQWAHVDYDINNYHLKDAALVATGDDPANIKIFIAELLNTGNSGLNDGYCRIHEVSSGGTQVIYAYNYGKDPAYSISLASDSRAPGGDANPFAVAVAWTGYDSPLQADELHLVYSLNGGADFTYRNMYQYPGLNRVSLSLGGTSQLDIGYYAIAFETNYNAGAGMGDVGLFLGRISSFAFAWADPVIVSHKYAYLSGKVGRPAVCLMQDQYDYVPGSNFVPLLITMEDYSNASNSDLAVMRFNTTYQFTGFNPEVPGMSMIDIDYPFGPNSSHHEKNPHMIYDRDFNHFLLTYSTKNTEELIYSGVNAGDLISGNWWVMGNYRSNTGDLPDNPMPHVDIDLSQGKAVFSWKDNYLGILSPAKSYFDTEWWVVDVPEAKADHMDVYPNPAVDRIMIRLHPASEFTYIICNTRGQVLLSGEGNQAQTQLNIPPSTPRGIYLLRIKTPGGEMVKKILLQ
jgi:hypothetical protein